MGEEMSVSHNLPSCKAETHIDYANLKG